MSAEIWLVRHGSTDWSDAGRLTGWRDIPLNDVGRRQGRLLRGRLVTTKFDGVWSSDLARAVETARLAADAARADERLRELDFGDLEGRTWDQCSPEVQAQLVAFEGFVAPGGESVSELRSRILAFVSTMSEGRHLIFTHGGVIRVLLRLAGRDDPVPSGSLTKLSLGASSTSAPSFAGWGEQSTSTPRPRTGLTLTPGAVQRRKDIGGRSHVRTGDSGQGEGRGGPT